jgi:hypothetical protein
VSEEGPPRRRREGNRVGICQQARRCGVHPPLTCTPLRALAMRDLARDICGIFGV